MTASDPVSPTRLGAQFLTGIVAEGADAASIDENTARSLELALTGPNTDWSYESSGAENLGGENTAFPYDLDGASGLIYAGPEHVTIAVSWDFQLAAGLIAGPEVGDTVAVVLMKDNEIVGESNEGWMDPASASVNVTGNARVSGLLTGHVLRLALLSKAGNEDSLRFTVDSYNSNSFVIA